MKHLFKAVAVAVLAIVAILMLAGPPEAQGQALQQKYFSIFGTQAGATNNYVVIPRNGNGAPVVTLLNIISDQAGRVAVFSNGPPVQITGGTSNTVNVSTNGLPGLGTNGFTVGDVVIVQRSSGIAERMIYTTNTGGGVMGLGFGGTLWTNSFESGDVIYRVNTNFSMLTLLTGNVTNLAGVGTIFAGRYGEPLLIEIITTAAGRIHGVGGFWENPPRAQ